jgi:hypothetical protein
MLQIVENTGQLSWLGGGDSVLLATHEVRCRLTPPRRADQATSEPKVSELAGRQGFELGAGPVSNMVMARDFWFQAPESQAVTSLRFVHCRPPESPCFYPNRGDILETVYALQDPPEDAPTRLPAVRATHALSP